MSNKYYKLLKENKNAFQNISKEIDISAIVKFLENNNFCQLPCKVGDNVVKLCPEEQLKNCNLADETYCNGCNPDGCAYGLFRANDFVTIPVLTAINFKVTDDNIFNVIKYWGVLYFADHDIANIYKANFYDAVDGETAEERYENYCKWVAENKFHFSETTDFTTPDEDFDMLIKEGFDGIEYRLNNEPSFADATEMLLKEERFRVYRHIPSERFFCLDRRQPYTFGRAVEVVCIQSMDITGYENEGTYALIQMIEGLKSMMFVDIYCGGCSHSKEKNELLWFRERFFNGGENND